MNRSPKNAHVLHAPAGDVGHSCHWPGCSRRVKPAAWGCRTHWFALPAAIRLRIWWSYRPGQEVSKRPSREYVAAAREAEAWILNQQLQATVQGVLP